MMSLIHASVSAAALHEYLRSSPIAAGTGKIKKEALVLVEFTLFFFLF